MPPFLSSSIFAATQSTHTTWWPTSAKHVPVTNPTYPVPMMLIFINSRLDSLGRTRIVQSFCCRSCVRAYRFSPAQDSSFSIPRAASSSRPRWRAPKQPTARAGWLWPTPDDARSEEHTSELQSRLHLVCRLLLEKKEYVR